MFLEGYIGINVGTDTEGMAGTGPQRILVGVSGMGFLTKVPFVADVGEAASHPTYKASDGDGDYAPMPRELSPRATPPPKRRKGPPKWIILKATRAMMTDPKRSGSRGGGMAGGARPLPRCRRDNVDRPSLLLRRHHLPMGASASEGTQVPGIWIDTMATTSMDVLRLLLRRNRRRMEASANERTQPPATRAITAAAASGPQLDENAHR